MTRVFATTAQQKDIMEQIEAPQYPHHLHILSSHRRQQHRGIWSVHFNLRMRSR